MPDTRGIALKKYIRSILALPSSVKKFLLTELLYGVAYAAWNLLYNFHLAARGFSIPGITLISSLGLALTAVLSLAAGRFCDRKGFRPAMVAGCLLRAAGIASTAALPGALSVCLGQALFSAGTALILSSEFPFILSLTDRESGNLVYNLLLCVANAGMFAGYVASGLIPGSPPSVYWKYSPVLLAAGLLFAVIGLVRRTLPGKPAEACAEAPPRFLRAFSDSRVLLFCLFGMAGSAVFSLVSAMSNIVYRNGFRLSDADVGFAYCLLAVVSCASYFASPLIVRRFGGARAAVASMALAAACLGLMAVAGTGLFIALWLLFFFLNSLIAGAADSAMLRAMPEDRRGSYSGARVFANNLGYGAGTALSGLILSRSGYPLIMISAAALALVQLGIYAVWCRKLLVD